MKDLNAAWAILDKTNQGYLDLTTLCSLNSSDIVLSQSYLFPNVTATCQYLNAYSWQIMLSKMRDVERDQLQGKFNLLQYVEYFRRVNNTTPVAQITTQFNSFDLNKDGFVDQFEYCEVSNPQRLYGMSLFEDDSQIVVNDAAQCPTQDANIWAYITIIFNMTDANQDGMLTKQELKVALYNTSAVFNYQTLTQAW